jgi:hypothetical protein
MARDHKIGVRRETVPIPPLEEHLERFNAGSVEFGVEYRFLNDTLVSQHTATKPEQAAMVAAARVQGGNEGIPIDDQGVSIHVFDTQTGLEWLRFDAFDEDPHYHYITPGSHHVGVGFDEAANGDCLEWVLHSLAERLPRMLREAGAEDLAGKVDQAAVDAVLPAVGEAARRARSGRVAAGTGA